MKKTKKEQTTVEPTEGKKKSVSGSEGYKKNEGGENNTKKSVGRQKIEEKDIETYKNTITLLEESSQEQKENYLKSLEKDIETYKNNNALLEEDIKERKESYLRLSADFENLRKRMIQENKKVIQLANEELITLLIPVLDDFQRALTFDSTSLKKEKNTKGIELIYQKFKNILEKQGLKPMETMGTDFDADLHTAITQIEVEKTEQKGKVMDEIEKGYLLKNKIIRYAKVVVGK